eukprot:3236902-Rhodomonas_salina.2
MSQACYSRDSAGLTSCRPSSSLFGSTMMVAEVPHRGLRPKETSTARLESKICECCDHRPCADSQTPAHSDGSGFEKA